METQFYCGSMNKIPLMKGGAEAEWTAVDDDRFEDLSAFRWYLLVTRNKMRYAYRLERVADGRKLSVFMHRHIMGLSRGDGKVVDHINRDSLDNRRSNLRICTRSENNKNRVLPEQTVCKRGHTLGGKRWIGKVFRRRCEICNATMSKAAQRQNHPSRSIELG